MCSGRWLADRAWGPPTVSYYDAEQHPGVKGAVALTMDDAPCRGPAGQGMISEILALLARFGAKATFMVCSDFGGLPAPPVVRRAGYSTSTQASDGGHRQRRARARVLSPMVQRQPVGAAITCRPTGPTTGTLGSSSPSGSTRRMRR